MQLGEKRREIRYFVTRVTDAKQFAKGARSHWVMENSLQYAGSLHPCNLRLTQNMSLCYSDMVTVQVCVYHAETFVY